MQFLSKEAQSVEQQNPEEKIPSEFIKEGEDAIQGKTLNRRTFWILPFVAIISFFLCLIIWFWKKPESTPPSIVTETEKTKETPVFREISSKDGDNVCIDSQNNVFYTSFNNELIKIDTSKETPEEIILLNLEERLLPKLTWDTECSRAIVESSLSPEGGATLELLYIEDKTIMPVSIGEDFTSLWGGSWNNKTGEVTYIATKDENTGIWETRKNNKSILITNINDIVAPIFAKWSPQKENLLVQGAVISKIYSLESTNLPEVGTTPWANESEWSESGDFIAFRKISGDETSLWITESTGANPQELEKGTSKAHWLKEDNLAFFTAGENGGALYWTVNPFTNEKTLLANASVIVWKPVDDFAISPNENSVVFRAQNGRIWLLELSLE